jgi:hypothetical protein
MESLQPEKFDYLCRNWVGVANVCFHQKRTFRSGQFGRIKGPLSAEAV